ncbi:zinc finger protein GAI-ASSOCIATED FACTOR 1-like [Oryza brachyantha]|uniref:zinc finger protein GAI-ASSOCIATED FACTOR 1-like n=1 Tax=Oryza brachyantha TaxID=4533 RepID=UPI001ADA2E3C|nr:zinc finger protein GAI-ASSOCIATED FACTOR 1-like [Oryza brachyantha]
MEVETSSGTNERGVSSSGGAQQQQQPPPQPPPAKKKRALPGMPDPNAEVIALSPKTLLATNRFVCEICNKGFQRDQNLQLHRRGHNLPWKLRQRSGKEVRKRVYVCPEPSCVHHDPSRALGDLTGIKKHFCRKHGEKKWKCDKCSKKYAVQSDWKAHTKTCGSREYRCDCGTLFSRRDSFITHRAFCDALAEESAKARAAPPPADDDGTSASAGPPPQALLPPPTQAPPPPTTTAAPAPAAQPEERDREAAPDQFATPAPVPAPVPPPPLPPVAAPNECASSSSSGVAPTSQSLLSSMFAPPSVAQAPQYVDPVGVGGGGHQERGVPAKPPALCLASNASSSLFSPPVTADRQQFAPPPPPSPSPHMSATALLQKAAQMGATSSSSSFLRCLGLDMSSSSPAPASSSGQLHHQQETMQVPIPASSLPEWPPRLQPEPSPMLSSGLGLGLPYDATGGPVSLPELMMGQSSLFSAKPATLDFLGLGVSPTGASTSRGFPAFIQPIGGAVSLAGSATGTAETFVGAHGGQGNPWERNPSSSPIL